LDFRGEDAQASSPRLLVAHVARDSGRVRLRATGNVRHRVRSRRAPKRNCGSRIVGIRWDSVVSSRTLSFDVTSSRSARFASIARSCHSSLHPVSGYTLQSLDVDGTIPRSFAAAGALGKARDVRLSFHPDQFVVLNSLREDVVISSVRELDAQAALASIAGADTIALPVGGASKGKGVPLVYDVHHHRCNPDGLDVEAKAKDDAIVRLREALRDLSHAANWVVAPSSPRERLAR
jgi:UV DNA damage repair endonuclease